MKNYIVANKDIKYGVLYFRLRTIIVMILTALYFFIAGIVNDNDAFLLISLSTVPVILVLYYQFLISENDIFTPLNFILVNLFFGTFVQSIYFMIIEKGESFYGLYGLSDIDSFFKGALAINITIISILVGYSLRTSKRKIIISVTYWKRNNFFILYYLLMVVAILSLLYYISLYGILNDLAHLSSKRRIFNDSGVGITHSYVILGANLSKISCLLAYTYKLYLIKGGKKSSFHLNLLIVVSFVVTLILPFLASKRSEIIYFLISMIALKHFYSKQLTIHSIKLVIIPLLLIVVAMGALRFANGRDSPIRYYIENGGAAHVLKTVAGSGNLLGLAKTGILIDRVPEKMNFQHGYTYGLIFYLPIPRSMWEEKPIVRIGGVVGPTIFDTNERSGVPPGISGEAYLNFGWFGIILIPLIYGIFARFFYDKFGRLAYVDSRSALIYSSLFTLVYFTPLSADFTGFVSRGLQVYIPIIIVLFFITKRVKK